MIQLTRLNNQTLVLNVDLVKFVERSPDTVITLVGGEKMIVRESVEEVVARIMNFRCTLMRSSFGAPSSPDPNHTLPLRLESQ
jgi:flagellar protein FlbD